MELFSGTLEKETPENLSPDIKSHGDYCYFHDDLD